MIFMAPVFSRALRQWAHTDKAPGYLYALCDRYGKYLYNGQLQDGYLPNGFKISCDIRDHVQRQIWLYGAYEPVEAYLFQHFLKSEMVVFDIGANVGQYTLLASSAVGPRGKVYGFEAQADNFLKFSANCLQNQTNKNIFLQHLAAWNEEVQLEMKMPTGMSDNAGSFYVQKNSASSADKVQAIRLDDFVFKNDIQRLDIIKMDIEGAESFALDGTFETLKKFHPVIFIEINKSALANMACSPEMISEKLFSLGYKAFKIGHSAETSEGLRNLENINQSNLIFHTEALPSTVLSGWNLKTALRWARQGWKY